MDSYQEISTLERISLMGWMSGYRTPEGSYFIDSNIHNEKKKSFLPWIFRDRVIWTVPLPAMLELFR
jgi:hypothetical protein